MDYTPTKDFEKIHNELLLFEHNIKEKAINHITILKQQSYKNDELVNLVFDRMSADTLEFHKNFIFIGFDPKQTQSHNGLNNFLKFAFNRFIEFRKFIRLACDLSQD